MKKVLMIVGSLRKDSFNLQLAKVAEKILKGQAEVCYLHYTYNNILPRKFDHYNTVMNTLSCFTDIFAGSYYDVPKDVWQNSKRRVSCLFMLCNIRSIKIKGP